MEWQYRQLEVKTQGFFQTKLPEHSFSQLNELAQDGWEVIQVVPITEYNGRTTRVSFILRRERQ